MARRRRRKGPPTGLPTVYKCCSRKDCRRVGKPIPMANFYAHAKAVDGKQYQCIECTTTYNARRYNAIPCVLGCGRNSLRRSLVCLTCREELLARGFKVCGSPDCEKAGVPQPLECFYPHRKDTSGRESRCKACALRIVKTKRLADPETARGYRIKTKFKISHNEYCALLDLQNGVCNMCGKTPEQNGKALSVDHDHLCCPGQMTCGGCTRSLLCQDCNLGHAACGDGDVRTLLMHLGYAIEHGALERHRGELPMLESACQLLGLLNGRWRTAEWRPGPVLRPTKGKEIDNVA